MVMMMKVRSYTMTCNCKDRQFTVCHKCLVKDCKRWYKFGKNDARTQQKKEILKKMKAMEKDNLPGVC